MKLKNWIRRSFRNRVFATILVVTLVPLLLCDVVMMQVIVARAEHTQARQARAALDTLSQRFDEAAGQCGDTLEALATSTITRSVLRRTEPDSRLLYQFLYLSAAAVRSYADLEIYDAQGTCLYSTDTSLAAAPADTDWGGLYAARTNGGTVFLSTGRGLMAARTVTGYGGELLGYVTARIESSGFAQLFDGVMAPADDLLVLDGTWRTVYYTRTVQADRTVAALRSQLESGLPFAAARAAAAETLCPGAADLLQTPNNILGIEYCKAILRQGAAMQLLPLPRLGTAHGTAQTGQVQGQALASASHIRQLVHTQGIKAASPFVPQAAMELYRQAAEQGQLADPEKFSTAVLTLLRTKTPEQLSTLRGAGEGLENRLYAAAREAETVNDLYDRLKTKRYPTARLRRLVLDAVLDVPAAGLPALPPYLLVLGAKRSALPLLKHAKIPAGTSLAGLAGQDQKLQIAADMHSKAVDFSLLCRYKIQPMGLAYTAHVVLL